MTYLVQKGVGAQVTERQRVSTSATQEADFQGDGGVGGGWRWRSHTGIRLLQLWCQYGVDAEEDKCVGMRREVMMELGQFV